MSKPIVVRLKKEKNVYEILTHHATVEPFREGKLGWSKVPYIDAVFKNSSKGDKYTDNQLKTAFGTSSIEECMKKITLEGELQLTSADRKKKVEELRKKIIHEIQKYYIDPKTKRPHPITVLEAAITQTKHRFTLDQSYQKQIDAIVRKLPEFIAVRKMVMEGTLFVPHSHLGKMMGIVPKYSSESSQTYTSEGCNFRITVVPGCYDAFMTEVNNITKGEATFTVDGGSQDSSTSNSNDNSNKKLSKKELKKQKRKKNRQSNK